MCGGVLFGDPVRLMPPLTKTSEWCLLGLGLAGERTLGCEDESLCRRGLPNGIYSLKLKMDGLVGGSTGDAGREADMVIPDRAVPSN